eukprot:TRINITY_DN67735_c0_g1_i1.p1 TRINITY_DN67735_c0_g1~~TRINITY_DN67735_c0_g1_i1.p1  ORF type:complete len:556 (-),score=95.02 TRINITY_DN67735_c0_g1_i1:14-1681(-)
MGAACAHPSSRLDEGEFATSPPGLTVMTFNVQQYQSFPPDEAAGAQRLRELTELQAVPADVICVQEGREDEDDHLGRLCEAFKYRKLHSSAWARLPMDPHAQITNQLYIKESSPWEAVDQGAELISSKMLLKHHAYKYKPCHLPLRTVVWVKLKPKKRAHDEGPSVVVLNTHVSGGRYEDPCFLQRLTEERRKQPERAIAVFQREAGPRDAGILVGDFNAPAQVAESSCRQYFQSKIASVPTVQTDRAAQNLSEDAAFAKFKDYMAAPFATLGDHGWKLTYDESEVGPTSTYGHLVDHMAVSDAGRIKAQRSERLLTCKTPGEQVPLPITDHNAVKVTFDVSGLLQDPSWYSGGPLPARDAQERIKDWATKRALRKAQRDKDKPAESHEGSQPGGGMQYLVVLRQADGHPTVRVHREPRAGASLIGEVPSGEFANCTEQRDDFIRVCWHDLDGWVGVKNARLAPLTAAAEAPATSADKAEEKRAGVTTVRQADGHPSVRVLARPHPGETVLGEIPSGSSAECLDHHGDFVRVRWKHLDGWVGLKNTSAPSRGSAA